MHNPDLTYDLAGKSKLGARRAHLPLPQPEGTIRILLLALLTGVLTGVAVWLFKQLVRLAEWLAFGWHAEHFAGLPPLLVLAVPVAGGLLVGSILLLFRVPEDPGHGVTEVIEAATLDVEEFPHRRVPLKASLAALSLGSGASLGPEDPAVEIGGGVGETIGRRWDLPHDRVRTLVAAGAASGISALFLAPLAAVAFAVEVFAVRLVSRSAALVAASALTAFIVMVVAGLQPSPLVPGYALPPAALALCLGLGLVAGVLSAAHVRFMYRVRHLFIDWREPPRWLKPALGGLILGAVGLVLPELLGIGYEGVERVAVGELPAPWLLALLMVGKMAMMAVSFGSGFLGGFFAPALFIGSMLGAGYGLGGAWLFPGTVDEPAAFAAVGMAAALAGLVNAPLTASLVLAAITGGYALLPFVLLACFTSHWTARRLEKSSLYTYTLAESARRRAPPGREDFGEQPDLS